jgi:phosphoribosylformylglycinamidine cyclo-ligase
LKPKRVTYKSAGVDIDKADNFIANIIPLISKTKTPAVLGKIGGFSGFFKFPEKGFREPVLVGATDGVGTKLMIAKMVNKHDTVGIDLVAMCVNDIITCGAEPLFFLDYFATSKINVKDAVPIMKGIVTGCCEARCALLGGETAEMPGLYRKEDYDLAGFCVGAVERKKIIDGKKIRPGDVILGLASNGLHSNGFSLVRKLFSQNEIKRKWGRELLRPTKIYVREILSLKKKVDVKGIAHITGGGFYGNIPRILPGGLGAEIKKGSWPVPSIFKEIQKRAKLPDKEMFRTFNMGIGMIVILNKNDSEKAERYLLGIGLKSRCIGRVVKNKTSNGISFL